MIFTQMIKGDFTGKQQPVTDKQKLYLKCVCVYTYLCVRDSEETAV